MKRRDFLNYSAQTSLLALGSGLVPGLASVNAFASAGPAGQRKKLVVVFLRGAADVLGMFSPKDSAGIGHLNGLRNHNLILQDANRIDAGLPHYIHKALEPAFISNPATGARFGDIAVISQSGSLNVTRSHFDQMDYIESGSHLKKTPHGFLARAVQALNSKGARPTLSVAANVPYLLRGSDPMLARNPASVIGALGVTAIDRSHSVGSRASLPERLDMYRGTNVEQCPEGAKFCNIVDGGKAEFSALKESFDKVVKNEGSTQVNMVTGRKYSDMKSDATKSAWMVSAVAMSDFNPSVMTIDIGGWDTHNNQGMNIPNGGFFRNLSNLGEALGNLRSDLKQKPNGAGGTVWDDTVVVVISEFGRTAVSNGSFGTDHGRGSAMIVMGGSVKKNHKNFSEKLNLSNLDGTGSSRALRVHVDYRDVMAEILHRHMGLNLNGIFEDYAVSTGKFLGVIKT